MKKTTLKIVKFKKGRDCYRCGISKREARKEGISECCVYGSCVKRHQYK